ncbi:sialidase family protein [Paraburkholderia aspalathi]|uniref:Sialidase domain-containing protein n=1 Tax=Paraburkholderia aspalathi TaxID=1324617 RepID=A0A1I7EPP0_9BURK|nr:sialidase family protein [Paraburkholderia aspalathi]SFU25894.1 hypothetical protein SAMN05192563_104329 [Paraburkholderia aspalathi]
MKSVLLFVSNVDQALPEIERVTGFVSQILSPAALIANLPDEFDPSSLMHASPRAPQTLDDITRLLVDAWQLALTTSRDTGPAELNEKGYERPMRPGINSGLTVPLAIEPPETSLYLRGKTALGLVIVAGRAHGLGFTPDEITHTISQVMLGVEVLASMEPLARVTFEYTVSILTLDVPPPTSKCSTSDYNICEQIWRDPTLALLGCGPGFPGVNEYNRKLLAAARARWGYTAFITKYPLGHFAYAWRAHGSLTMEYWDSYWRQGMAAVFAHETAHLFGASDEYDGSRCTCAGSGYFNVPNFNCDECESAHRKQDCLMKENDRLLCPWSRGQIGWPYTYEVLGQSTSAGPAFTAFQNRLFCMFKSNDAENRLLVMSSSDALVWTSADYFGQTTQSGPAFAVFQNRLYCAFRSNDEHNRILVISSPNGKFTTPPEMTGHSTSDAPALAEFNGRLYCAFRSQSSSNELFVMSSQDGRNWALTPRTGVRTSSGPALAVFRGKLFCAFRSNDDSNRVLLVSTENGNDWSGPVNTMWNTYAGPGLAVSNGRLLCVFRSADKEKRLLITSTTDGQQWSGPLNGSQRTRATPSVVRFDNMLYIGFQSDGSGNRVLLTNTLGAFDDPDWAKSNEVRTPAEVSK